MGRCLIVANQTLGGARLEHEVRQRIERGEARFYVVVPMTEPEREATTWSPQDPVFGMPRVTEATQDAIDQARRRSERRLETMLDRITALGGEAEGGIGGTDPVEATRAVLDREACTEVIVSTLPAGISRWVKLDVPSRIERQTDLPVTVVEAEG